MNRRQRRRAERNSPGRRVQRALAQLQAASDADGRPWILHGMTEACVDCGATGSLSGQSGRRTVRFDVEHDPGCPAAAGITPWAPVELTPAELAELDL